MPVMQSQYKPYRQLTQGQRYQIEALHRKELSFQSLAELIGVYPSSIS
jgi:transposase, IS30 family